MDAFIFWKNFDAASRKRTLISIVERAGLNYKTIKNQRSGLRLPGLEDAYALAKVLDVSLEYLLTGEEDTTFPPRLAKIIKALERASDLELSMVEKILDIPIEGKDIEIQKVD